MNRYVPEPIEKALKDHFITETGSFEIINFKFASGGCINSAGVIETNIGEKFIKWNDRERYPGMFEAEARGLKLLREPAVIKVPEPQLSGEAGSYSFLLTEFIDSTVRSANYWEQLGQDLAALHRVTSDTFGLDHDNYIGSLPQINNQESDWITFYRDHRLEYQLKLAVDHGKMGHGHIKKFQQLYSILESLLDDDEDPSLLHGDLWSGNLMTGDSGEPVIFDPAVYFGHREVDLAMTLLFGGFDHTFYDIYDESFPLAAGHDDRLDIYQLYPLMVHVNLFGGGYISQAESILNRYV